jgi:hypothetical protein
MRRRFTGKEKHGFEPREQGKNHEMAIGLTKRVALYKKK